MTPDSPGHLMARGKRRINPWRKQIIMNLFTVRRHMAKVEYRAMRLPLALPEECVVARYWQEEATFRLGFERFLGSLDEIAGWLMADDDISERGQALMRTKAQPRRAQADENLHAGQEQARQDRGQAHEGQTTRSRPPTRGNRKTSGKFAVRPVHRPRRRQHNRSMLPGSAPSISPIRRSSQPLGPAPSTSP